MSTAKKAVELSPVQKIIESYGGRYKLAKDMNLHWAVVNKWYKDGAIPVPHLPAASKILGVPAAKLNAEVAKVFA